MFWYRHGQDTILFPGDMMPEGMKFVLKNLRGTEKRFTSFYNRTEDTSQWHLATGTQPNLDTLLRLHGLSVLVAPHHGLESCWSPELYATIKGGKPKIVAIGTLQAA